MRALFLIFCFGWMVEQVVAGESQATPQAPQTADTREDILAVMETIKGFGHVDWTETSQLGRRMLAVWFCPFSGRAAVCIYAYYYDGSQWQLFFSQVLDDTYLLSVEMPADQDVLRFRSVAGSIIRTEPLDKVPKFYPANPPTNSLFPRISRAVQISWPSETNRLYRLQYTSTLDTNLWIDLGSSFLGNGLQLNTFVPSETARQRFFRLAY